MKKDIFKLNRPELINELRGHTSKQELDRLMKGDTAGLRAKLAYHLSPATDKKRFFEVGTLYGFPVFITEVN